MASTSTRREAVIARQINHASIKVKFGRCKSSSETECALDVVISLKDRVLQAQQSTAKRNIICLVDNSGSMASQAEGGTPIEVARGMLWSLYQQFDRDANETLFGVIPFSETAEVLVPFATSQAHAAEQLNIQELLGGLSGESSTNLTAGIETLFNLLNREEFSEIDFADVFIVTDGMPDNRERAIRTLSEALENYQYRNQIIFHVFADFSVSGNSGREFLEEFSETVKSKGFHIAEPVDIRVNHGRWVDSVRNDMVLQRGTGSVQLEIDVADFDQPLTRITGRSGGRSFQVTASDARHIRIDCSRLEMRINHKLRVKLLLEEHVAGHRSGLDIRLKVKGADGQEKSETIDVTFDRIDGEEDDTGDEPTVDARVETLVVGALRQARNDLTAEAIAVNGVVANLEGCRQQVVGIVVCGGGDAYTCADLLERSITAVSKLDAHLRDGGGTAIVQSASELSSNSNEAPPRRADVLALLHNLRDAIVLRDLSRTRLDEFAHIVGAFNQEELKQDKFYIVGFVEEKKQFWIARIELQQLEAEVELQRNPARRQSGRTRLASLRRTLRM